MDVSPIDARSVASVLSEVAGSASETLQLQDVIGRIALSTRRIIPLDNMAVIRILDGEWAIKHAVSFQTDQGRVNVPYPEDPACRQPMRLTSWSPRMRPRAGLIRRIDDTLLELDPTYEADASMLRMGIRSMLWQPFGAATLTGGVGLSSFQPHAFNAEHEEVLRPIAALLGSAVEHWRIWDQEKRRHERLDQLESLFATLAGSLDIREVFTPVSTAMQPMVPHDVLVLTELDLASRHIRVVAMAGQLDGPPPPAEMTLLPEETAHRALDFELVRDIRTDVLPDTEREKLLLRSGMRSWLRVPVSLGGEARWSLGFFHREPARYDQSDVEVAARLADRVALMLSHQQLAEEARHATEARERAERLAATVETLARELEARGRGRVVGVSPSWKDTMIAIGRVASSETTVLITGESGTGKEVVANLVHQGSPRAARPFVAINCAALPEQLLESELFGHERGAFTGAIATKIGRIEQAAGGTLFLDEIGEMTPLVQAKLLRVLEAREFQRLGGNRTLKADVRVIAATNRDLHAAIERQTFREDLYYRLNVFQIPVAPLRDRPEDIVPLAETFLDDLGRSMGRPAAGMSRDGRAGLLEYPWPGNVRELRNAIERAILVSDGGLITREHLPARHVSDSPTAGLPRAADMNVAAMERGLVERALAEARGNKSRAARLLGITRSQLYWRIEKYGLD